MVVECIWIHKIKREQNTKGAELKKQYSRLREQRSYARIQKNTGIKEIFP